MDSWDKMPLRAQPECGKNDAREWWWNISKEDIHPDGVQMLNGTTLFFKLSYQNPRRPPLYHENFWQARHYAVTTNVGPFGGMLQVSSSAAVPSWIIISRLRWIRIELLSEVLRIDDTGQIHFEFVTVNLANHIKINTSSPHVFNFDLAFMSSPFSSTTTTTILVSRRLEASNPLRYEQSLQIDRHREKTLDADFPYYIYNDEEDGRVRQNFTPQQWRRQRVLQGTGDGDADDGGEIDVEFETPYTWKGYTEGIEIVAAKDNEIEFSCDFSRVEYVRFRVSGIKIPWEGGQSIFNIYTTMRGDDADRMENCCPPGYPASNPGYTFLVPHRMDPIDSSLQNEFQQEKNLYPIMGQWETRYNELCLVTFRFQIPVPHEPRVPGAILLLTVRSPPGYAIDGKFFQVYDAAGCARDPNNPDAMCGLVPRAAEVFDWVAKAPGVNSRIDLMFPDLPVMYANFDYRVELKVFTPESMNDRDDAALASSLWVLELSDLTARSQGLVSTTLGPPATRRWWKRRP
jgi:hypothetical protein